MNIEISRKKMEMDMNVRIVSRESIEPSTKTPSHLKSHKLSLLDHHFSVFEYRTPSVLFYAAVAPPSSAAATVFRLKDSLSKTLSLFYPLAGRIDTSADTSIINCTDDGAPLVVARADCSLSAFLGAPNRVELLPRFLPNRELDPEKTTTCLIPMILQISVFECGGVAIGTQILHKTLDGISRTHFFKTWAAFAAGREGEVVAPDFKTAVSLFPPGRIAAEITAVKVLRPIDDGSGGCVAKAFRFSAETIVALQSEARSEKVPYPTRVESVSGFIWKHAMAAARVTGPSLAIHSVNMRPHLRPPLPPTTYGKFTTHATANYPHKANPDLPHLVATLHRGISEAKDFSYISKFLGEGGEEGVRQHMQKLQKVKEANVNVYGFTSWGGLDVDFGFGMPLWIGFTGGPTSSWFQNFIVLILAPGYEIQAWLILDEQEMANLESDPQFLAFATPCSTSLVAPRSSL